MVSLLYEDLHQRLKATNNILSNLWDGRKMGSNPDQEKGSMNVTFPSNFSQCEHYTTEAEISLGMGI